MDEGTAEGFVGLFFDTLSSFDSSSDSFSFMAIIGAVLISALGFCMLDVPVCASVGDVTPVVVLSVLAGATSTFFTSGVALIGAGVAFCSLLPQEASKIAGVRRRADARIF